MPDDYYIQSAAHAMEERTAAARLARPFGRACYGFFSPGVTPPVSKRRYADTLTRAPLA